jgi:Putative zinc-binding metallo-peptidase
MSFSSALFAGEAFRIEANTSSKVAETRKTLLTDLLSAPVFRFPYSQLSVFLDEYLIEPRGRMKGGSITLSNKVAKDAEFIQLFTHEFAHFLDIYVLVPKKKQADPSNEYYMISWSNPTVKRIGQTMSSFVSGYAATNQYEDFAESFVFYVFQNQTFLDRAMKNDDLRQKYLFFQKYVFPNGTFVDTNFALGKVPSYVWDSTKIQISLQKYLYSVK